jgi:catechol 2,3-dioxygenase-like lactoylglutathione lyase family enzyme
MVLHHVRLVVSSLPEAKKFYLAALAPLGFKEYYAVEGVVVGLSGPDNIPNLWLGSAKGPDDPPTKGAHIAFAAENREVVAKFHEAALYVHGIVIFGELINILNHLQESGSEG